MTCWVLDAAWGRWVQCEKWAPFTVRVVGRGGKGAGALRAWVSQVSAAGEAGSSGDRGVFAGSQKEDERDQLEGKHGDPGRRLRMRAASAPSAVSTHTAPGARCGDGELRPEMADSARRCVRPRAAPGVGEAQPASSAGGGSGCQTLDASAAPVH